jgi:hypothetical protein
VEELGQQMPQRCVDDDDQLVGANRNERSSPVCARLLRVGGWAEGGDLMATVTRDMTKDELYREAKRLGIKGRSRMTKGRLKAAIERRRSS